MVDIQTTERKRAAPYVPASALSEFFDHIRYVQTPKKVDSNLVLDYGISKSQAFALISTLKFLGLTDDNGIPTPAFRALQTGGEEFQKTLNEIMKTAYSDLFSRLDVSRDSRDKIVNFFARNYSPATAERATALFLDLCGEAGIETAAKPRQRKSHKLEIPEKKEGREEQSTQLEKDTTNDYKKQDLNNTNESTHQRGITQEQKVADLHGINIKIDSKDLAAMNAQQITALFDGLSKIMKGDKKEGLTIEQK